MTRKLVYSAALVAFLAGKIHKTLSGRCGAPTDTTYSLYDDPDQYHNTQMDKLG